MSWQEGTATDYHALLQDLVECATNSHVATAAVNAGGTGYAVGDILRINGGTTVGGHTAAVEVLTLSGSAVATIRIYRGGSYTVNPGTGATTTAETGSGTGCTVDTTIASSGWTVKRRTQEAVSAAIGSGGSGYSVSDQLTVVGGVGVGTAAVFNVDSVSSGAVTGVSLVAAGDYEEVPANDVSVTGGGGSGCELTVSWQDASTQEQVLILEGEGAGSDEILVGIETYNVLGQNGSDQCYNWSLVGMTGYNAGLTFENQPGIGPSVGAPPSSSGGAYIPLKDNDSFPIEWFFSITTRRIVVIAKVENALRTHYVHGHLGWMNPSGTTSEFPYPILIAGSSARHNTFWADTETRITGLTEMIGISGKTGPGWFRTTTSVWQEIKNTIAVDTGSESRAASQDYICYPCGIPSAAVATADQIVSIGSNTIEWNDIIPTTGVPGVASFNLHAAEDSGGDLRLLVPATIIATDDPLYENQGELDGVFWVSGADSEANEDRIKVSDDRYRIFQNGNRALAFSLCAILEA